MIGNLYTFYLAINQKQASQWRVLSAETLKSPLSLPVLMTKGPRWNTHAIIGTLGPFSIQESISIDLASANNSAQSWIAVIYSFPAYKTIASLDSEQHKSGNFWVSLPLQPGKYSIGLRYYSWSDKVYLPSLKVDDKEYVKSQYAASNINDFYNDLINQKNWFYLWLHYYIFTILRLREWLPESFIKNEYLPVGAPDTQFFYNYLKRNQSLQIEVDPLILNNYEIYLTLYDRSSLPISWCQIRQEKILTNSIENNGFYLIRVRPKSLISSSVKSQLENEETLVQQLKFIPDNS